MTIIVSYQRKNDVLMLGDLMLSGAREQAHAIDVPTRFNSAQPEANLFFIGLSQKLLIVNKHLAVAWAGSKLIAKHLITRIANEIAEPYTSEKILNLIYRSGLSEEELKEVSFIFIGADTTQKTLFVQDYLTGETKLDDNQKFKYAGSGTYHFLDSVGFKFTGTSGDINDFEMMVSSLIGRMVVALYEEIISDRTHNFFYGGGFELLRFHPIDAEFLKFPLTFAFWTHDAHAVELAGPIITLNYENSGYLFVHRLTRDENQKWRLRTYPVSNILNERLSIPACPRPDFNTFFSVHYLISLSGDNSKVRMLIKKGDQKNVLIHLLPDSEEVRIDIDPSFTDEVRRVTNG